MRYSTYSTYSKGPGDCEGSAWCRAWHRSPAAPARHRSPAEPAPTVGAVGILPLHRGRFSDFALASDFARKSCGSDVMGSASLPELGFIPKNPSPGQRRRSVSDAVLAVSLRECFFHHLHALPSILLWQQDCPCQSCCGNRIAPPNPAVATGLPLSILLWQAGLPLSILLWQQDCSTQSCCGNRIAPPIPVLATGLSRCTTSSSGLELFLPEHRLVMESAPL